MKYRCLSFIFCLLGVLLSPLYARADNYQTSVECAFSHKLGDDSILMYGMQNHAMWHDFFGNQNTNAFTTYESLRSSAGTTCDSLADSSAYWTPSMQLPNGTIAPPKYAKIYYQTINSTQYPLTSFPPGLELLAGDHKGTTPNSHITFLCNDGRGYTNDANRICQRTPGSTLQVNISVHFPTCWDGKTLKAKPAAPARLPNAVYSNDDGSCPADYPAHIPGISLNVAYIIDGYDSLDLNDVKLSLDPQMNGEERTDLWGSIYTAHGDFVNGWSPDAAKFMTERCMNNNDDCTGTVPYSYRETTADTYVSNQADSDKNFGAATQLLALADPTSSQDANNPQKIVLFKFPIPALPTTFPADQLALFKYRMRLNGALTNNPTDSKTLYLYKTTTQWDENTVTWNTRPTCDFSTWSTIFVSGGKAYYNFDVDAMVRQAVQNGQTEIGFCMSGDSKQTGNIYGFDSKETPYFAALELVANQPVSE